MVPDGQNGFPDGQTMDMEKSDEQKVTKWNSDGLEGFYNDEKHFVHIFFREIK